MDYAMLSRLHIQSTSDQQNPLLYPAIAAAAPASVLPEQAGNWAYAQPEMSAEESAFTLATGILGRLYLSGHLNRMPTEQLALVREAVGLHKNLVRQVASSVPFWPLGLGGSARSWVAQGLRLPAGQECYLTVWRLPGAAETLRLPLVHLRGADVRVETLFPTAPPEWPTRWDAASGTLDITATVPAPSARVLRVSALRDGQVSHPG